MRDSLALKFEDDLSEGRKVMLKSSMTDHGPETAKERSKRGSKKPRLLAELHVPSTLVTVNERSSVLD